MTKEQIGKILDEHRAYLRAEFSRSIGFRVLELADYLEELFDKPVDILTPAGVEGMRVPQVAADIQDSVAYV